MLNRKRLTLQLALQNGDIPKPQMTYGLSGKNPEGRWAYAYMWSEKDIFEAWEYFSTVHKGRPRKDGLITPMALPSRAELRALMKDNLVLYTKTEDGQYVPSYKAEEF